MKITRKSEEKTGPRTLRFTPAKVRALPELSASGGRKTLLDVGLFVGEIQLTSKLSLRSSEIPTSLVFSASQTMPLLEMSQRAARQTLIGVDLFVEKIEFQRLFMLEIASQNKTGPRTLSFSKAHELPLPSL
jgi:hypothetical protein